MERTLSFNAVGSAAGLPAMAIAACLCLVSCGGQSEAPPPSRGIAVLPAASSPQPAPDAGEAGEAAGTSTPQAQFATSEGTEHRVALVIGNASYSHSPLRNPVNDARGVAQALRECGFDVIERTECDLRALKDALDAFSSQLTPDSVALFYFSGHGVQVEGRNYLVPIGAEPSNEADVEYDCLDAGRVLSRLERAGAQLNILILDACRNNPFRSAWNRSAGGGLALMAAPPGSIIAYATAIDSVASDGDGEYGTFTGNLLKHLPVPDINVEEVLRRTAAGVQQDTDGKQVPWRTLSYTGIFYFVSEKNPSDPRQPPKHDPSPRPPEGHAFHKVAQGENLYRISLRYGVTVEQLQRWNNRPDNTIHIGETIIVGSAAAVPPVVLEPELTFASSTDLAWETENGRGLLHLPGGITMEFVRISAGSFVMGAPEHEEGTQDDERPQHTVTLGKDFWMGKVEVTQEQWRAMSPSINPWEGEDLVSSNSQSPAVCISWDSAQQFVHALNRGGAGRFRLPTEAEWEYAARAGSQGMYPSGVTLNNYGQYAWFDENTLDVGSAYAQPVGTKQPNAWGLHDMHGNAWEWCQDFWSERYPGGPVVDPTGPSSGTDRIYRGGGWRSTPRDGRSANRGYNRLGLESQYVGFRLCRDN